MKASDSHASERARRRARKVERWCFFAAVIPLLEPLYSAPSIGLATPLVILMPWMAIWLVWRYPGLYRLSPNGDRAFAELSWAVLLPGFILAILVRIDLHALDRPLLLVGGPIGVAALFGAAVTIDPTVRRWRMATLWVLLASAAYGFGVAGFANAKLDRSPAQVYRVHVWGYSYSRGGGGSWNLELGGWNAHPDGERWKVSGSVYEVGRRSGSVCVNERAGAIGIRWFTIDACAESPLSTNGPG